MQMSSNKELRSLTLGSAHEKFDAYLGLKPSNNCLIFHIPVIHMITYNTLLIISISKDGSVKSYSVVESKNIHRTTKLMICGN